MCCLAARSPDASSAPVISRPKDVECRPGEQVHRTHVIIPIADYQAPLYDTYEAEEGNNGVTTNSPCVRRLKDRQALQPKPFILAAATKPLPILTNNCGCTSTKPFPAYQSLALLIVVLP